jgi:histone H3/H4
MDPTPKPAKPAKPAKAGKLAQQIKRCAAARVRMSKLQRNSEPILRLAVVRHMMDDILEGGRHRISHKAVVATRAYLESRADRKVRFAVLAARHGKRRAGQTLSNDENFVVCGVDFELAAAV